MNSNVKFRDPKTGEVFEDIDTAIWNKCRRRDPCDTNCPLFKLREHTACRDYVISHPADAARLMGLEVVESHAGDTAEMIKEESMKKKDKPRICEVLGGKDNPLEVGEPFKIEGYNGEYHVNDDGVLKWGGQTSDDAIYEAINHPDRIIRQSRFTGDEITLAGILRRRGVTELYRKEGHGLYWRGETDHGRLPMDLFSSIRVGETIRVEEVMAGPAAGKEQRK